MIYKILIRCSIKKSIIAKLLLINKMDNWMNLEKKLNNLQKYYKKKIKN